MKILAVLCMDPPERNLLASFVSLFQPSVYEVVPQSFILP
jgi:hypothetical protein